MTDPVRVVALLWAQQGKGPEQVAAFTELAPVVRAEDGCLQYDLHADLDDPDRFVVIEQWASREALGRHAASGHMKAYGEASVGYRAQPAQVVVLSDERVG